MAQVENTSNNSSLPVHPTEIIPGRLLLSSREQDWREIVVERHIQPPSEIDLPPMTTPVLLFHVHDTVRQISRYGDQSYEGQMRKDNFILLPPAMPSFFSWESYDETIEIMPEMSLLRRVVREACEANPDSIEILPKAVGRDAQIERFAYLFSDELADKSFGGAIYAESLANAFALHLLRNYCSLDFRVREYESGLTKFRLRRVVDYINDNLAENLSLAEISESVGISAFHFSRQFKHSTGLSPYQYILRQRIDEAKRLLKETNLSLVTIAYQTGFSNQSHFGKVFRRVVGITPASYRTSLK